MKLILAIIRPESLESVREKLYAKGIDSMTVIDVQGHGKQKGHKELYRGREYQVEFLNKIQLELAVADNMVDPVIEAIASGAKSGSMGAIGDGKIFVTNLEKVLRIRTGETNESAL
ncbi:MAG: P-II family nitrogen regulator [Brevinematales bacterium]|nr:P-II family nitrogen regulator [Brevinematales bacterium]